MWTIRYVVLLPSPQEIPSRVTYILVCWPVYQWDVCNFFKPLWSLNVFDHFMGLVLKGIMIAGIYTSNFDVWYTAQKTQSFNWVLKFSLHEILFSSIFGLNWHSKLISSLGFIYFKLFICHPDVKRLTFFRGFTPHPSQGLPHEPVAKPTAPRDLRLHFKIFGNTIFAQKRTLIKLLG